MLLRAGEIVEGLEDARARRPTSRSDHDLAQGPARLCVALGIRLDDNGADVLGGSRIHLTLPEQCPAPVRAGPSHRASRASGGTNAYPWRFWIPGERSVSPYKRHRSREARRDCAVLSREPRSRAGADRSVSSATVEVVSSQPTTTPAPQANDPSFDDVWEELVWRGYVHVSTDAKALKELLAGPPIVYYCGFDPTAPSLHLGNLVQLLLLRRIQLAGHKPLGLVGGSTGLIGDPRPTAERTLNDRTPSPSGSATCRSRSPSS